MARKLESSLKWERAQGGTWVPGLAAAKVQSSEAA